MGDWKIGDWVWTTSHGEACRVVSIEDLWGSRAARVWLPASNVVIHVPESSIRPLEHTDLPSGDEITFVVAAARIADTLATDQLLAPLESTVIPLPHQIHALSRAMTGDRIRYLLADEVGLGKTVEAGLVLRELKLRGLVERVLVVAPAGLVNQWVAEMRTHFSEEFHLLIPGELAALRRLHGVDDRENIWRRWDQVVCPMDSVKPVETRRGWSRERTEAYNRERFVDLITAGWDLVIIDEAHRLSGSTEQVARYKLGEALAQAVPYLLLLSATPHQGKTDGFRRLMAFLDSDEFIDEESVDRDRVSPYVIRTEKRIAIDAEGNPLFKPRYTQLVAVQWQAGHEDQRALYDAVTEYVREGYNQAMAEKNTAVGFLMLLMQRLVSSSTRAIRAALERRLEVLHIPNEQLTLFPEDIGEDWAELDSQEQMEEILTTRLKALKNERQEVELLLSAARKCEARGVDAKAQALLDWMYKLQQEENDPEIKFLVFTSFVPTQEMLKEFLSQRGFKVVCLNGSMGLDERQAVQKAFAREARVMVSTEAGGEGLNLQFCHVVFNYDLPWNPMRLEQRIGRVDRIGQTQIVRALNFALDGTVELRVRKVLEQKLATILEEFGVDKLADVLDSEEGGIPFEEIFKAAVLTPEAATDRADWLAEEIRQRAREARESAKTLNPTEELLPDAAQSIANHRITFWTERMVVSYLRAKKDEGASVEKSAGVYHLRWPDGTEYEQAVFTRTDSKAADLTQVTIEDRRVRALLARLPQFVPGQAISSAILPGISDKVSGIWSLWRIALQTTQDRMQRFLPLFVSSELRVLAPTAKAVWDALIDSDLDALHALDSSNSSPLTDSEFSASHQAAQDRGQSLFRELVARHEQRTERARRRGAQAFEARKRAIAKIGLETVRRFRYSQLQSEMETWQQRLTEEGTSLPELTPLLVLRVIRQEELR